LENSEKISYPNVFNDIKILIDQTKHNIAVEVNATMSMLYWNIGNRVNIEILNNQRAEYGKQIVYTLAKQLETEYGSGWSEKQLRHCMRFAEVFSDVEIVSTLWRQFSWSHIKELIYIENELKRQFYIEMCKIEKWSVRTFRERVNSLLYERTAISKKPEETIKNELKILNETGQITPELVFRDPYFLDFLGLKDTYSEKDFETAIVVELQKFISELGSDFAFLARQKRITIDKRDYYIDLLFYHRRLKSLIVIDLKIGEFDAAYKGEMELYLGYLNKYETIEGENSPIGLILCSGKNPEHLELLHLENSNIKVSDYLTILPQKEVLFEKLHRAIEIAKNQLEETSKN
jgi:predicted nuclease of restriction endonuclease-like (RecB) superfamily